MPMTDILFAYGTLMTAAHASRTGRRERERLAREARSLGAARLPGRLVDLGRYPGLVEGGDGVVHGEALRLTDPEATLAWLDAYEGIVVGEPDQNRNEYERVIRGVTLQSGAALDVWVYLYRKDVTGLVPVADGRWPAK